MGEFSTNLNVIASLLIAAAYFCIAFILYYFAHHRPDLKLHAPALVFAAFIFAAGIAHFLSIWDPVRLEVPMKAITAAISIVAAIFAMRLIRTTVNTEKAPPNPPVIPDTSEEFARINEELRRSNVEVEQFAHVASHDLQEPLRMISNYLQLIERRYGPSLDDDGREFIGFAVDGAKRMKVLIKDLLDFSRAGTGAGSVQSVPAGSLLTNALANLKSAIAESDAHISADPLPSIVVDSNLLTQVFQNLIANAIKFQEDAAPRIHISAERQSGDWIFSIRDNGIGIEPRHHERIFRIFERLHASEEYSGSGIGLSIAKKIVEKHGGKIWVESQPGAGSTFYFSLAAESGIVNAAKNGGS